MCGSGTIAIEAAMILSNRAPGLGRSFAAEQFPQFSANLWSDARAAAEAAIRKDAQFEVYASDIDDAILDVTYENALRAGVEEYLNIFQADVRKIEKKDCKGTIVCNPPYGERLMTPAEAAELYRDMGRAFANLAPWQIYIITSHPEFERLYGQRADKVKKLYNGMLPCYLYEYFKPAEARTEGQRTAKEIFDRKPDRRPDHKQDSRDFKAFDRKEGNGKFEKRPYPPKKKPY
jgi:putative N6-adenine-specific DNA methylase